MASSIESSGFPRELETGNVPSGERQRTGATVVHRRIIETGVPDSKAVTPRCGGRTAAIGRIVFSDEANGFALAYVCSAEHIFIKRIQVHGDRLHPTEALGLLIDIT